MQNKLSKFMVAHNFSNERTIRELSKIRAIEVGLKKRLLNPLTKTQKDTMNALGLKKEIISDFLTSLNL